MMMMIPYYLLLWFTLIVSFPLVKGRMLQTNDSRVFVPGIFDTANFLWGSDVSCHGHRGSSCCLLTLCN